MYRIKQNVSKHITPVYYVVVYQIKLLKCNKKGHRHYARLLYYYLFHLVIVSLNVDMIFVNAITVCYPRLCMLALSVYADLSTALSAKSKRNNLPSLLQMELKIIA